MTERLVTGIGVIFFRAKNSGSLALWYEKHFGICSMQSQQVWRQDAGDSVLAPFAENTAYFGRIEQQFMINLRVSDLDKLITRLDQGRCKH